jgi:hypothetical protein
MPLNIEPLNCFILISETKEWVLEMVECLLCKQPKGSKSPGCEVFSLWKSYEGRRRDKEKWVDSRVQETRYYGVGRTQVPDWGKMGVTLP